MDGFTSGCSPAARRRARRGFAHPFRLRSAPSTESAAALAPFRDIIERLKEVPGLGMIIIETLIAEVGGDMSPFPIAEHLISWAGLAPRLDESAGKRRSTRIKKHAPWLKPVLV